MPDIIKLISELEEALYSSDVDIIDCLKKARIIAKYYNDLEIILWIENELTGYKNENEIPEYRRIIATLFKTTFWGDRFIGVRGSHVDILGTAPLLYGVTIEDIIKKSEKDTIDLTIFRDGKQGNIKIKGSDLKKIIMEVNLKLSDYIQEKSEIITKYPYKTTLMKIFNRFHRVAKLLEKRYGNRNTIIIND